MDIENDIIVWAVWGNLNDLEDPDRTVMSAAADPKSAMVPDNHVWLYSLKGTYNEIMQKYYDIEDLGTYIIFEDN